MSTTLGDPLLALLTLLLYHIRGGLSSPFCDFFSERPAVPALPLRGRCWLTFISRATGLRAVEVRGEVLQTRVGHTLSGFACPS